MSISIERAKMRAKTANLWYTHRTHTHTHARPGCGHVQGQAKRSRATVQVEQVKSSQVARDCVPFEFDADWHFLPQPQCLSAFASECGGACLVCGADRAYTWFLNSYSQRSMCTLSVCACVCVSVTQLVATTSCRYCCWRHLRPETWNRRPAIIKAA